jgi:hypothetical protein
MEVRRLAKAEAAAVAETKAMAVWR